MTGKRKKDPEYHEIHAALSELYLLVETYLEAVDSILNSPEGGSAPSGLVEKRDKAQALLNVIDDDLWPTVLRVAGTSSAISHRRAGGFF